MSYVDDDLEMDGFTMMMAMIAMKKRILILMKKTTMTNR